MIVGLKLLGLTFRIVVDDELERAQHGNAALGALKDENEKLRYAYSVFALQMQAMPQFAKKSDTPRELRGRLRRRGLYSDEDMAGITAAFEKAEYSGGANASEAREATAKLCRIIRRNMI